MKRTITVPRTLAGKCFFADPVCYSPVPNTPGECDKRATGERRFRALPCKPRSLIDLRLSRASNVLNRCGAQITSLQVRDPRTTQLDISHG